MSLIQEERYDEPVFKPYKFRAEVGDCAEMSSATYVDQTGYRDNVSFRLAGRTMVKHAP